MECMHKILYQNLFSCNTRCKDTGRRTYVLNKTTFQCRDYLEASQNQLPSILFAANAAAVARESIEGEDSS